MLSKIAVLFFSRFYLSACVYVRAQQKVFALLMQFYSVLKKGP